MPFEKLDMPADGDRDIIEGMLRRAKLTRKESRVVRYVVYRGIKQTEVSEIMHISKQRINTIYLTALSKIEGLTKHKFCIYLL